MTRLVRDPETGLYHWNRGLWAPLSEHFTTTELQCPCGCEPQLISSSLISKLEELRADIGGPVHISSGYRCKKHQDELRAAGNETAVGTSTHELGMAADLSSHGFTGTMLQARACKYFQAIGTAATWIHVDLRADKTRRWTYSK